MLEARSFYSQTYFVRVITSFESFDQSHQAEYFPLLCFNNMSYQYFVR
jgi:hypothetical protein